MAGPTAPAAACAAAPKAWTQALSILNCGGRGGGLASAAVDNCSFLPEVGGGERKGGIRLVTINPRKGGGGGEGCDQGVGGTRSQLDNLHDKGNTPNQTRGICLKEQFRELLGKLSLHWEL